MVAKLGLTKAKLLKPQMDWSGTWDPSEDRSAYPKNNPADLFSGWAIMDKDEVRIISKFRSQFPRSLKWPTQLAESSWQSISLFPTHLLLSLSLVVQMAG